MDLGRIHEDDTLIMRGKRLIRGPAFVVQGPLLADVSLHVVGGSIHPLQRTDSTAASLMGQPLLSMAARC
jgi:hypothetical protein